MSVRTDVINLNVNINGDKSRAELNKLKKEAVDITVAMKGLKKGTKEYTDMQFELAKIDLQMAKVKNQIGLTALTLKELTVERRRAEVAFKNADPLTKQFKEAETYLNRVIARQRELRTGVDGVRGAQESMFASMAKGFTLVSLIDRASAAVNEFFRGAIDEALEAEEATARLAGTLDNLGRGDALDGILAKADEMAQKFTNLDNDEVVAVFEKLIDYGKLTTAQMDELLPIIINFAAKQRISITEATDVITKALEGQGRALKTYGIDIKDAKTESERFALVTTTLKEKVEGAGEAFLETGAGGLATYRQELKNTQEDIGKDLLPALAKVTQFLSFSIKGMKDLIIRGNNAINDIRNGLSIGTTQAIQDAFEAQTNFNGERIETNAKVLIARYQNAIKAGKITIQGVVAQLQKEMEGSLSEVDKNIRKKTLQFFAPTVDNKVLGISDGSTNNKKGSTKKDKDNKVDQAKKDLEALLKYIEEKQFEVDQLGETALEKELNAAYRTYEEKLKLSGGNKEAEKQLTNIYYQEVYAIQAKYGELEMKELEKRNKAREKALSDLVDDSMKAAKETVAANKEAFSRADENKLKAAERAVRKAKGLDKLKQLKDQLDLEERLAVEAALSRGEKEEGVHEAFKEKRKSAVAEFWQQALEVVVDYARAAQAVLEGFNNLKTAKENKELADDKKRNDVKRTGYKKQLDNKLISQAQFDLKTNQLNEQQDAKEREIKIRQAKREKSLRIFDAIINTAAGIAKAIPNLVMMGVAALVGGLQIAAIKKAPLPEFGDGDWIRKGAKHTDKEKGIPVLIERDEAVMKADAMTDKNVYKATGTTAQITSALNKKAGGVSWAGGAVIEMAQWRSAKPSSINPNLPRIMEQGGVFRPIDGVPTATNTENLETLVSTLIAKQEENTEELKNMKTKLHAVVSIKEYRETEALYDASKKASGLTQ